ncbi:hypothetical protein CEUSTIGMA_g2574.t1 [Chlamydomonas eustigma]|uniref:Glycosyltransferase n=1 Tax=Chlamydomonas eustigma TaxID=1157962 RepID=A0A250WX72_9CHLO|nr:hypothetical protein CEUSTIGMA_g2574.t1 [Chlamydomonas eustigma]|eukprot:GAX75130.1 hypothetical protein CEUSTIGMA_g2574.t1 [Chlamydomonas eustigma]
MVAALDPWTSKTLGQWDVHQCFNAPMERLRYKGSGGTYEWGSNHWHETTWNKVRITSAVYELGFHIIHSDADVTWFKDPMPFFSKYFSGPPHVLFSSDALETQNLGPGDQGLEADTGPHHNINTGVYFIQQYPGGKNFLNAWLSQKKEGPVRTRGIGHDQDGLNLLARGKEFWGNTDPNMPSAWPSMRQGQRMFSAVLDNSTLISLLPVSMFGNAYTYVTGRVHEQMQHPLYEVHWVWSGTTLEAKQQTMRDALKFWDPPEYYNAKDLALITFDIWIPEAPETFNSLKDEDTEKMLQFHVIAANRQLRQAYYGFIAAMGLGRILILPKFHCFCAKNWKETIACRVYGEKHSTFPFECSLSQLLRAKRLLHGLNVESETKKGSVTIREHSFLSNQNVPDEIKKSRLVLEPAAERRLDKDVTAPPSASLQDVVKLPDGSFKLTVPWPLDVEELKEMLKEILPKFRIVHLSNATKIVGFDFYDPTFHAKFDEEISKMTTYWCCRSQKDVDRYNASVKVDLRILPEERDQSSKHLLSVFGTTFVTSISP